MNHDGTHGKTNSKAGSQIAFPYCLLNVAYDNLTIILNKICRAIGMRYLMGDQVNTFCIPVFARVL